jgi:hypothetical protein
MESRSLHGKSTLKKTPAYARCSRRFPEFEKSDLILFALTGVVETV